jgi:hypothetical protein
MRSRHTLASPTRAGRTRKAFQSTKQAARLALSLALLAPGLLFGGAPRAAAQIQQTTLTPLDPTPVVQQQGPEALGQVTSEPVEPVEAKVVSFRQMSELMARNPAQSGPAQQQRQAIPSPGSRPEPPAPSSPATSEITAGGGGLVNTDISQPNAPSPSPAQSFLAQEDGPRVGTTTFTIPPDTNGAVGLDKVFTQTNANFRIHNKLTGAPLDTINADTFWAPTGATGVFDPRVVYDPYQNRWITAIVSNASTANSSVLIGVSQTSDPQGTWLLYRFVAGFAVGTATPAGFANGGWADFPMLGFNKNWVAIGYNMHAITNNAFVRAEFLVLNYPGLRAGTLGGTRVNAGNTNFCVHPATTLSPTEETLYLVEHLNSSTAQLGVFTIRGTAAAPALGPASAFVRPGGGWVNPGGDLLPQTCVPGSPVATFACPATPRKLETSDANVRGNVVFRNGRLWYSQTVGIDLPGGDPVDHTAAQWTSMTPSFPTPTTLGMTFNDGGRVEDATATATNGGKWYAYTSIGVNKNNDVMLGFSEFESDDFVDAAYAFRAGGDAAGTMRDPVVYKDGEDYYEKTFGTARNRFGDYSHAVVDPANDTDLWTVQEYTQPRVVTVPPTLNNPLDGLGSNSSRWSTWWAKLGIAIPGALGDLVISEFRLRGPGGAEDEFVEIHNRTDAPITVTTTDGSAGYALAASDGVIRHTIPNGTTIPARGHYLIANSDGYSLSNYPAGTATTATPNGSYTENIPDNGTGEGGLYRGIALFNTANTANFATGTRFDAVGPTSEPDALYREGAGLTPLTPDFNTQHAWVRDPCGKQGNMDAGGSCPSNGAAVDNNNNALDFFFVDTDGLSAGAGQRLGAPGPENLSSPVRRDEQFGGFLLDQTKSSTAIPNRTRNATPGPAPTFNGTLELRRRIVNNTGGIVTRLRFRLVDTTTFPASGARADVRGLTSTDLVVGPVNDPATCAALQAPPSTSPTPPCDVTVRGLTLETPPAQPNGGGFNSSFSADSVTITPLAPGQSINIRILLGIQQTGNFRFLLVVEALP